MGSSASTQNFSNSNRNVVRYPKHPQEHPIGVQSSWNFSHSGQPLPAGTPAGQQQIDLRAPAATPASNIGPSAPPPEDQDVTHTSMDKQTLMRYVEYEKDINRLEALNVVEHLQVKWDELKGLEEEIKRLTAIFQARKEQTLKEKKDVDDMREPSVRSFFADQSDFDERMSREQEEYLAALNKQEVAQKELDAAVAMRDSAKASVKEIHVYAEQLQSFYKEQDALLATIFDGKYGSEMEFRLEREHDAMSDRQRRIAAAKARWQAGRLLIHHGCAQLGHASRQWETAASLPTQAMQQRYVVATETRNYLIAACANLRNSQNYLKGIDFPYCRPEEINTVERAANNIYTDVATNERHQHALNVYRSMFQRSGALLQWFDTVINKTIDRDLLAATEELFSKKRDLRMERVRLIKEKLTELLGPEEAEAAGLDDDANLTDARRLHEQLDSVNQEEMQKLMKNVKVTLPEGQPQGEGDAGADAGADAEASQYSVEAPSAGVSRKKARKARKSGKPKRPSNDLGDAERDAEAVREEPPPPPKSEDMPKIDAVSLRDLAPPPSQEQLFGDIDSIKKQYEIDMDEYQRAQDLNRARVEQGLQEKLAARKSRKARKMAQEQETEKLLKESANA